MGKKQKKYKKGLLDHYFSESVDDRAIFLEGLGKWPKGSLVYVIREIASGKYGDFDLYFSVTENTADMSREYFEAAGISGIECVISGSGRYKQVLAFAKYLINEADFPNYWIKKKEQIYVNIWHGTPLKKLGVAREDKLIHDEGNHQRNFIMADYILCPNDYTRDVILDDYCARDHTKAKLIMQGYPRTSELLKAPDSDPAPGKQVIAFMPTWREGNRQDVQIRDMNVFFREMDSRLDDDQVMFVNLHHKIEADIDLGPFSRIRKFPEGVDVYDFLRNADILITDYSSIMFDYAVTRRKIILYCPDLNIYSNDRGFYFSVEDLPFPKVTDTEQLTEELRRGKEYDDSLFMEKFCCYESPDNAKHLCDVWLSSDKSDTKVEEATGACARKVLLYSDSLSAGSVTDLLYNYYSVHDENDYHAYLSFKNRLVSENMASAYPLIENRFIIGCKGSQLFTKEQKPVRNDYLSGGTSFRKMMSSLESAYAVEQSRRYPGCDFALWLLCDTSNYDTVLGFSHFSGPKALLLHNAMTDAAEEDAHLRDAVRYYCKHCDHIFALADTDIKRAKSLFGIHFKEIKVIAGGRELDDIIGNIIRQ